jgi:hypothetical protein
MATAPRIRRGVLTPRLTTGLATGLAAALVAAAAGCAHRAVPAGTPTGTPPASSVPGELLGAGLVADPTSGGVLAFGGYRTDRNGARSPLDTTRTWDGTTWHTLTPPVSPPAREDPLLVADPATRRVLLFGGTSAPTAGAVPGPAGTAPGSTLTAGTPTAGTPTTGAPAAAGPPAGRPPGAGHASPARRLTDAWSWDGHTWQQVPGYAAQVFGQATYDPATGTVVLVGSVLPTASTDTTAPPVNATGTWSWTGHGWTALTTATPTDTLSSLAYDPVGHRLVGLAAQAPYSPPDCRGGVRCPLLPSRAGYVHLWNFDGRGWQRDPADGRLDQTGAALAVDPTSGTLLLVTDTGHTWAHRAAGWMGLSPAGSPPGRAANTQPSLHAAATSTQLLLVVSDPADHAWSYDGRTWHDRGAVP